MTHPLDFTDKVALVTGAAAGMRLATARAFAAAGAAVVLAMGDDATTRHAEYTRRFVLWMAVAAMVLASARGLAPQAGGRMNITRNGLQPSAKEPAGWFTGTVRIDPLFDAPSRARAAGASVTFEPGARTAWHTHPLGQTLIVMAGVGSSAALGRPRRGESTGRRRMDPPGEH